MGFTENGRKIFGAVVNGELTFGKIGTLKLTDGKVIDCKEINTSFTAYRNNVRVGAKFLKNGTINCDCTKPYDKLASSSATECYYLGLCYGTSSEKETKDDYTLVTTNLIGTSHSWNIGKSGFILNFSNTCYNGTQETITVKEIGLVLFPQVYTATNDFPNTPILLYRKVLDSPVTILPDETYTFTLILK